MFSRLKINLLIITGLFLVFSSIQAGYLNIEPVIIDKKAKSREVFKETVTLINNANYKTNIYAAVHNLDKKEGEQGFEGPAQADLTKSLANWIEINRGVIQLLPGEKRDIDFLIKVGPRAMPGIYHAGIAFYEGSDRIEAEKGRAGPVVLINLEIVEKIDDVLRLKKFAAERTLSPRFPVSFIYKLENSGDEPVALSGEIRIFNRRGEEVDSVKINETNFAESGKVFVASHDWQGTANLRGLANLFELNKNFGRYKAVLYLRSGNQSPIQDITFFWMIPWQILTALIFTLLAIIVMMTNLFRRFYEESNS